MHNEQLKCMPRGLEEIETHRQKQGLTQRQLCRAAGVNPSSYTRWLQFMRGSPKGACPNMRTLSRVSEALMALEAQS
ncbi:helix-turn-helix transcriptional regulator [Rhodomicrobium vannielii ATCC 17100]|uniref:helix-turn-helix domain-containing protein n=1 Tax=Rhodomicrobium vannielii TaxID=1069 RepID=UPI001917E9C8|nr:helix-turn-helix transcriptional regulator [Rhodomicrobium vannielii ATCC 17100]